MPDLGNYFSLHLDTTGPSLSNADLSIGDSAHRIGQASGNALTISCTTADKLQFKVWGIIGDLKVTETGDGSTTEFTPTFPGGAPDELTGISVNGADLASGWDYDSDLGKITFSVAPSSDAVIDFKYRGLLSQTTAPWEDWGVIADRINWTNTATKSVEVPNVDGTYTISVRVRDDVFNESDTATVSVTLDTAKPTVSITYLETQSDRTPTPKVSEQTSKNTFNFRFTANEDFAEYKVCVVADNSVAHTGGTIIGTTYGSSNMHNTGTFAANEEIACTINGSDLKVASSADGQKVIKIFIKDLTGNWSD